MNLMHVNQLLPLFYKSILSQLVYFLLLMRTLSIENIIIPNVVPFTKQSLFWAIF